MKLGKNRDFYLLVHYILLVYYILLFKYCCNFLIARKFLHNIYIIVS
uniref:Uncharacterized protein n=1 Tax=Bartonella rochalimae ATCC BAA-1498 TaxID=685782 RepID=E6YKB9_9HYPH|nr:hypothetical protein BARRO_10240 [Bartonella rochalimae ATCC BAA-1498]